MNQNQSTSELEKKTKTSNTNPSEPGHPNKTAVRGPVCRPCPPDRAWSRRKRLKLAPPQIVGNGYNGAAVPVYEPYRGTSERREINAKARARATASDDHRDSLWCELRTEPLPGTERAAEMVSTVVVVRGPSSLVW